MRSPPPQKTPADYMVIAMSPALIMMLAGSLSFFLIEVFFRGEAAGSVRWVMFWFVLAVVLVARIGIEQGGAHAMIYGLLLAAATWCYLVRIHPAYLLGALLLGLVWWCAHQLTRDCTLIDDEQDASGSGLLQMAGWRKGGNSGSIQHSTPTRREVADSAFKAQHPGTESRLKPSVGNISNRAGSETGAPGILKPHSRKGGSETPHPPGIWLVYFSLAALPLFGIGQMLMPSGDTESRKTGLELLFVYLTAALGLLLTTSFLGLRRYLRQRHLVMPQEIALGWIRFGAGVAIIVLLGMLLMPRPGGADAWSTLRYHIDYRLRQASQYAMRGNPAGEGKGRSGTETTKPDNQANQSSEQQTGEQKDSTKNSSTQPPHSPAKHLYILLKILFYLAAGILFCWRAIRRRDLLLQMFRSMVAAIAAFFRNLFAFEWKWKRSGQNAASPAAQKSAAFSAYENPFQTGKEQFWPPEQIILYSYNALRAWAEEHGVPFRSQHTAREFCLELGEKYPTLFSELDRLSFLYGHAAFGVKLPENCDLMPLRELWNQMGQAKT